MTKKKILIPSGKNDDMFLVQAAQKLGLYVITSGYDESAPAHKISDKYICADYSDQEAMLKIAEEENIDYMCSCANDRGMLSTAYVCEKLGLPGHDSYETTMTIHKKDRFEALAEKIGLSTPESVAFDHEDEAVEYLKKIEKRMIMKPTDGCAGRGISELAPNDNHETIIRAVKDAFAHSIAGRIVIEPYIDGDLHSASVYLINQKVVFCFIEEGLVKPTNAYGMCTVLSPARDKMKIQQKVISEFEKIAAALHLVNGKMHANLIVDKNGNVHILEMHRRCSGDTYSRFIEASTGVRWNEWIVKAEMGLNVDDFPKWTKQKNNIMYHVLVPPRNGLYEDFVIEESLQKKIIYMVTEREKGSQIKDCRVEFAGIVAFQFESCDEMYDTAKRMNDLVKVIMG